ncbi:unnamed protein product [Peronospora destructor]|uniref:Uncharacterized protein n=1 Tax=Peronospora destructor TaxID=86335 RepID=A0AAV0U9Z1_9STRA|nr:unnamed protein product [Peronospora destructor]
MSFLLGDDYASSSSESESDREESVTTRKEANSDKKPLTQLLPLADSVLSSVAASTASFLPPNTRAKLQSSVKSFDLIAEQETQRQEKEKEEREQHPKVQRVETSRNDRKRQMQETASSEPLIKREKKDAKERVKSQRLKGQSGIGSDFRGWKPETEMALRQQFD